MVVVQFLLHNLFFDVCRGLAILVHFVQLLGNFFVTRSVTHKLASTLRAAKCVVGGWTNENRIDRDNVFFESILQPF